MIFDQSNQKESQTIEALVPMVDLFAVLAIVFMIYASDEINITELTTADRIQEVERESEERVQEVIELYESDPQAILAKEADKTLEEVKEKRRKKAEELVLAFSAMLEAQQDQAADEYENLVASIEQKHDEALSEQLVSMNEQKQVEIETEKQALKSDIEAEKQELRAHVEAEKQELRADVQAEKSKLKKEQEEAVEKVRQDAQQALAEQVSDLELERWSRWPNRRKLLRVSWKLK